MPDPPIEPIIGIIGGAGPYAGLDLVKKIFDQTLARGDQEHLSVALLSLPGIIADRTAYLLGDEQNNPATGIAHVALQLERIGATVVAIPCNTAHAEAILEPVLWRLRQARSTVKMLHLIGETIKFLQTDCPGRCRIGVLSTNGTYHLGLYARPLEEAGYQVVLPTLQMQEEVVHRAIYHPELGIKAQAHPVTSQARQWLEEAVLALKKDGAEVIILGCTELPLALPEAAVHDILMIDPATILARALIREVAPDKLKPSPALCLV